MSEHPSGRRTTRLGLVGLLVLAALSPAAALESNTGSKEAGTKIRMLTDAEVAQIGKRFPRLGLRPQGVSQVSDELLEHLFPSTVFCRILVHGRRPPLSRLIAIRGDSLLMMPDCFNWLLQEHNLRVADENIIELARAFVLLATGNQPTTNPATGDRDRLDSFPQITFLDARKIKELPSRASCDARLKVKVGGQEEEWYFENWHTQFGVVSRGNAKGLIKQYDPVLVEPRKP